MCEPERRRHGFNLEYSYPEAIVVFVFLAIVAGLLNAAGRQDAWSWLRGRFTRRE
jgi:hypothetical protein